MSKQLKRKVPELVDPELDERVRYLWHFFVQLHNATDGKISPLEIKAHFELLGITLNRFEYRAILAMEHERKING